MKTEVQKEEEEEQYTLSSESEQSNNFIWNKLGQLNNFLKDGYIRRLDVVVNWPELGKYTKMNVTHEEKEQ